MTEEQKKPFVRIAMAFSIVIGVLTLVDYSIPRTVSEETVIMKGAYTQFGPVGRGGSGKGTRKLLIRTNEGEYPCSYPIFVSAREGQKIEITKTSILREIRKVTIGGIDFQNDYSFYNYLLFPIALWLSTLLAVLLFVFRGKFGHLETLTIISTLVGLYILIVAILNKFA